MEKRRSTYLFVAIIALAIAFSSCDDERYLSSVDAELHFSVDTLMFDTIFTSIGSATQSFRVINPYDQPMMISSIALAGGDKSNFRLNVDGILKNDVTNIELAAHDSLYIFVEVTIDPNGSNQPMIVKDSIVFVANEKMQHILLMAWGQDFIPIEREVVKTTTWKAGKPYVIFDYAYVDSAHTLNIEPGARIYFHNDAYFYVKGSINAVGTVGSPIVFTSDRREKMYENLPDQWWGIVIFPSSQQSRFENVAIRNANIGLQVGTIEHEGGANVRLHNVKIENMAYAGIFALKSTIAASNTLVANCGFYCVTLLIGGDYQFNHCTLANYWSGITKRSTSSLVISNQLKVKTGQGDKMYFGALERADWRNSIVWGNMETELELGRNEETAFNYSFDHCILKLADSISVSNTKNYREIKKNIEPKFLNAAEYNFELDTLSVAKDAGSIDYGAMVPLDFRNQSRISDNAPDLGAYERIEKSKKSAKKQD